MVQFTGVKVFSSTMHGQRAEMGANITAWLAAHPGLRVVDKVVSQSSDSEFHCLSIVLFYVEGP
jgi:hypothetical protein